MIRDNGARYDGDLTKQITHLISFKTEGAKYKAAKAWGLRIVSIEWLRDSLERGMILDEKLYDPSLPLDQRGIGAWKRDKPKTRVTLGKRLRDESTTSANDKKRKLRRSASAKLKSQSEGLWSGIAAAGGGLTPQVERSGVWESQDEQVQDESRTTSNPPADSSSIMTEAAPEPPRIQGIFSGCRFFLDGFETKKAQILGDYLVSKGGELSGSAESLHAVIHNEVPMRLFRIIPSSVSAQNSPALPGIPTVETITEWWVERCLHHKEFLEPSCHVIGRPFPKFPIEGFGGLTINSAAFSGIDLLHCTKAVKLVGASYSEDMTPQSSLLLTKSEVGLRRDKTEHAQEWNIPILNATWLWDSISAGEKLPFGKYKFRSSNRAASVTVKPFTKSEDHSQRSKSDLANTTSKFDTYSSYDRKPARTSGLDATAFKTEGEIPPIKEEINTETSSDLSAISDPSPSTSTNQPPLSERSQNISSTVSTAPAPSNHPAPKPTEDFIYDVSDLLTKTKTAVQPAQTDTGKTRTRILGRAVSNLSTGSCASSVDSTATHGNPVEYPSNSNLLGKVASATTKAEPNHLEHLLDADQDRNANKNFESHPPSTQLEYDDPQSLEYRERVMARMMGEVVDPKRKGLTKEKSITLGDISEAMKPRVTGRRTTLKNR